MLLGHLNGDDAEEDDGEVVFDGEEVILVDFDVASSFGHEAGKSGKPAVVHDMSTELFWAAGPAPGASARPLVPAVRASLREGHPGLVVEAATLRLLEDRTPQTIARAADRVIGGHPSVVLSESYWRTRFESNPNVLNETLIVNGEATAEATGSSAVIVSLRIGPRVSDASAAPPTSW